MLNDAILQEEKMNSDPKISVILITYNHEKYIAESVNSILLQTYSDFELIIVDDGSSDNTLKIIQEYDDTRIRVIEQENSGPSIALNTGINKSRGQFIALMSGDDVSLPNRLTNQIEQIELQKADMIFSLPQIIGPDSKILSNSVSHIFFNREFENTADLFRQLFIFGNFLCAPTCFCRRTAIEKVGQFKRGLIQLQDFDYWIRACKKNLVIKLNKYPVLRYRYLFGANLSGHRNSNRISLETVVLYRSFFDDAPTELLRNSFDEKIKMNTIDDEPNLEIDISFLFLEHSNPNIKAIGIERIILQLENEKTYKILSTERDFDMSSFFQLTKAHKPWTDRFAPKLRAVLGFIKKILLLYKPVQKDTGVSRLFHSDTHDSVRSDNFASKLKTRVIMVRKKTFRFTSLILRKALRCPKAQVEQCIQYFLERGEHKRAVRLTYVYIILGKIRRLDFSMPGKQMVFSLSRLYDYSKQTNTIAYEEAPENIYLKKPVLLGNFSDKLFEGDAVLPRPYVSIINSAIITGGSSLVISENANVLLNDEMVDFYTKEFGTKSPYISYRSNNKVIMGYKKISKAHVKEGILLSCDHDNNYFHWLVECLPKLVFIDDLKRFQDLPLLIPKGLHENLMAALAQININNHPIISLEHGVAYQVDQLIFPSPLSRIIDRYEGSPAFDTDIILSKKWILRVADLLKNRFQQSRKPWRKLYLARRKGLRALGNQDEIELLLSEHNFEIIDLDNVSLDSQIQLFSQATLIVAPTGAALTNMLLCQPGTKVVIFMSNHETTNHYFWSNLGNIAEVDVTLIIGQRLFNLTNYYSVHDDYIVDPNIVLEEIKKFEQQQ